MATTNDSGRKGIQLDVLDESTSKCLFMADPAEEAYMAHSVMQSSPLQLITGAARIDKGIARKIIRRESRMQRLINSHGTEAK